jgi:hypothetical protein
VKPLFAALLLFPAAAAAIGLQDEPVGAKVGGTFQFGNKRIHAPAGDWTLIARQNWTGTTNLVMQGTNFSGVYLAEIKDGALTRAIQAYGNVDPAQHRRWRANVDPCKPNEKALASRNLSDNDENQFCYDVAELRGYMKKSTEWRQQAQQWLETQQVKLPRNVLMVRFAKLERSFRTEVYYYFAPEQFAGQTTAEKAEAAARWAEEQLPAVRAGLATPGP